MGAVTNAKYEVNMPVLEYIKIHMDSQVRDTLKADAYNIIDNLYYEFSLQKTNHVPNSQEAIALEIFFKSLPFKFMYKNNGYGTVSDSEELGKMLNYYMDKGNANQEVNMMESGILETLK